MRFPHALPRRETLSRRQAIQRAAVTTASATMVANTCMQSATAATPSANRTGMGLVIYDQNIRRRHLRKKDPSSDLFEPLTFLKHCHALGAGGMQAQLGELSSAEISELRDYADEHNLFIDAIVKPAQSDADLSRFEAQIKTARDVGVQAARATIIPGRRYERFKTLQEFREFEQRGRRMLERSAPIVEKHRVPLAIENHKDQRLDERVGLFEHLSSEFVGACLDTGNSFALLDGAYEPIEVLAPYAFTVHLKDQALQEYSEGFLLGDIPLGQGSFDLKRMVSIIRKAKPNIKFALELITRDPLKVPCMKPGFFATMPQTPAQDLAMTMQFVRNHSVDDLQQVSSLPLQQQIELESANVATSIQYAGGELGI